MRVAMASKTSCCGGGGLWSFSRFWASFQPWVSTGRQRWLGWCEGSHLGHQRPPVYQEPNVELEQFINLACDVEVKCRRLGVARRCLYGEIVSNNMLNLTAEVVFVRQCEKTATAGSSTAPWRTRSFPCPVIRRSDAVGPGLCTRSAGEGEVTTADRATNLDTQCPTLLRLVTF